MGLTIVSTVAAASAESYSPLIYRVPSPYAWMQVEGAGDNGVMTGFFRLPGTVDGDRAGYLTPQGFKSLHPAGFRMSRIDDSWYGYHCGMGVNESTGCLNALFWVGGEAPANLHPGGYMHSIALGGSGQIQVGMVQGFDDTQYGAVWGRTSTSFRRLQATGYNYVVAHSTDGTQHVGQGSATFNYYHALLWPNTSSPSVDLNPESFMMSIAMSTNGTTQGGYAHNSDNKFRACLWHGTKESYVNLHPAGYAQSVVNAVRGDVQVGYASVALGGINERQQAVAWHGTAASVVDLHALLPSDFQTWHSVATDVDNFGNIVGYVASPTWGMKRPVIWKRS